jgi:hypothetical protein
VVALTLRRLINAIRRRIAPAMPDVAAPDMQGTMVTFTCNLCGGRNTALLGHVENREYPSCTHCKSSLRMRSLMYLLSLELFGKPLLMRNFPLKKNLRGVGMSDWGGYAIALATKLDYVNTYYHTEPRLDITDIGAEDAGKYDFLISSDVFEHIPIFDLERAFMNSRRLLNESGFFLFTVPFKKEGETREHFPRLHRFSIEQREGKPVLVNRTVEGIEETHEDLVFHGGDGMTLEMRVFSQQDLLRRLQGAGYASVKVCSEHYPPFGVLWPTDFDVPIVARVQ